MIIVAFKEAARGTVAHAGGPLLDTGARNLPQALPRDFYSRPSLHVARALLGQRLVRRLEGQRLAGRIVEVEAYIGMDDPASHAHAGKTARNATMFGPPGYAYVYLIYGIHCCLNLVTEAEGFPAAILIRAVEPVEGIAIQQQLRAPHNALRDLARGPGRLCQAFAIDRRLDGADLCTPQTALWVEPDAAFADAEVLCGPRIGVTGDEAARNAPWRFFIRHSPWVSGARKLHLQQDGND